MFQHGMRFTAAAIALLLFAASAGASAFSRGPAGANAAFLTLPDGTVVTGAGINVGQVEIGSILHTGKWVRTRVHALISVSSLCEGLAH